MQYGLGYALNNNYPVGKTPIKQSVGVYFW